MEAADTLVEAAPSLGSIPNPPWAVLLSLGPLSDQILTVEFRTSVVFKL